MTDSLETRRLESDFEVIMLADSQGAILDSARAEDVPAEAIAALFEMVKRIAAQSGASAHSQNDESTFFDWEGRQIIARWFMSPEPRLLVILVAQGKPYKQALRRLIKALSEVI